MRLPEDIRFPIYVIGFDVKSTGRKGQFECNTFLTLPEGDRQALAVFESENDARLVKSEQFPDRVCTLVPVPDMGRFLDMLVNVHRRGIQAACLDPPGWYEGEANHILIPELLDRLRPAA